jgi:exodeoxyribonuclease VII large subunit
VEPPDCLVVTRGGGSLEDLWAFNEEIVVRAIYASRVPVVSAVGHEIDVTLSDLAADVRALTPSEAAERVAPAAEELALRLRQVQRRLAATLRSRLAAIEARLDNLGRRRVFRRPLEMVFERARRVDELEARQTRAMANLLKTARGRLDATAAQLDSLSPLAVLGRGYSITERLPSGEVVRDASALAPGERIRTRLASGGAISRIEEIDGV